MARAGIARVTPHLYRADKLNGLNEDISSAFESGSIEMQTGRRVKMRFTGTLRDTTAVTPYSDYLAPFMEIHYSNGVYVWEQLGLFSIPPMGEDSSYFGSRGQFEGFDLGWNLSQNTFGTYYSVTAGNNVVNEVISILSNEGFTRINIPPSAKTFPKSRTYHIQRDKWNIINAMLQSIGYYHAWVDRSGYITSMPYKDYDRAEPGKYLTTGENSEVVGTVSRKPATSEIYNKVRVIGERPRTNTPIIQTLINSNPLSKTSTNPPPNGLGRTIQLTIQDSDINDSATALEVARHALQVSSSMYYNYEIYTLPDPSRDFFEVFDAELLNGKGDTVLEGRYRVSGWQIDLTYRSPMRFFMHRTEPYQ